MTEIIKSNLYCFTSHTAKSVEYSQDDQVFSKNYNTAMTTIITHQFNKIVSTARGGHEKNEREEKEEEEKYNNNRPYRSPYE